MNKYEQTGKEILKHLGGEENIESATHCATRLRLVLKDNDRADKQALEQLNDVKGVFSNSGQFQIIIGQGVVNKVYSAMVSGTSITQSSVSEAKRAAMKNLNPFQRFARTLSNIFVPIIPAIVASGLLMGLLGMVTTYELLPGDSGEFMLLNMFSNAAFIFLPIIIAFSAAKEFNANPYLSAALGGILIHPELLNAWAQGGVEPESITIFGGISVDMIGYQGTVLPILIAVWVLGYVERGLRRIVPNVLDIIVTPFVALVTTGFVSLTVIGPLGRYLGEGISFVLTALYDFAGPVAGIIFGGLYSTIVITGIHHSFHAIELGLLADVGRNFLLPIWSMANVAQGGAALAVYFKTTNKKVKSVAIPASVSSLLGITEAAIFGVNLRFVRPFIAAAIGGAVAAGYVTLMNVAMTGVGTTGITGAAMVEQGYFVHYIIGLVIAFGVAFVVTYLLGIKEDETDESRNLGDETDEKEEIVELETFTVNDGDEVLVSPLEGTVLPLENVPDETFAQKILGDGIAINPTSGLVTSPVDGTVGHLFDTKHAIAIVSESGAEILIHVGIETVNMNGNGFKAFVKTGDKVKAGDKLIEFDLDLIKKEAKSTITPILVTNMDKVEYINLLNNGHVQNKTHDLLAVKINK